MNLAKAINQRIDILDVVSKYCDLTRVSDVRYKCSCPIPGHDDTEPSFFVDVHGGYYHCYGCDAHGDAINFEAIMRYGELTEETNKKAIKEIAKELGISNSKNDKNEFISSVALMREEIQDILHKNLIKGKDSIKALLYLNNRGVTKDDIEKYGIGLMPDNLYDKLGFKHKDALVDKVGLFKEGKGQSKHRNFFPKNVITFPMITQSGVLSHWHMKFTIEHENIKSNWQMYGENRGECLFFNEKSLNFATIYIVEGPFEVIQIEKRGYHSIAVCGSISRKQIKRLSLMRKKGFLFEETWDEARKTLKFWFDRDENKSGQKKVERSIYDLGTAHKTLMCRCPEIGQDPDEYLRGGGLIEDIEEIGIPERPLLVEERPDGKGMTFFSDNEEYDITNFVVRTKYYLRYQDRRVTRYVELIKGEDRSLVPMEAEDIKDIKTFRTWVQKYGAYSTNLQKHEMNELRDFIILTSPQKTVDLIPFYGEFIPGVWLFENGAIMEDGIHWRDKDGIIWINKKDKATGRHIEGVATKKDLSRIVYSRERPEEIKIPEEWADIGEVVENVLKYYRPDLVMKIIGYAYAVIARDEIFRMFSCFPQKMLVGFTGEGKTALVDVMQSFLGCKNTPTATVSTTVKGLKRHMVKYVNLMLHITEYTNKFKDEIKNAFDGHGYSFANRTTNFSTSTLPSNAVNLFTTEDYPAGMSVVNRCIITDFKNVEKFVDPSEYENYMDTYVDSGRNIGFLIDIIQEGVDSEEIRKNSDYYRKSLRKIGKADKKNYTERLLKTYGIVYGCFETALKKHPGIKQAFTSIGFDVSRENITRCIGEEIDHSEHIVARQDPLAIWLSNLETLHIKGSLDGMCNVSSSKVTFSIDSCHNEVKAYNRRSDGSLSETRREDIASRIEAIFGIPERTKSGSIRMQYTIPKEDLVEFANTSFNKLWSGDYEDDDDKGLPF